MTVTDQRKYARHEYKVGVDLVYGDGTCLKAQMCDISLGGAYVLASPTPPFGSTIDLLIALPGIKERCKIVCLVRWIKADQGIGLQFQSLRAIEVWALNKLLHTLSVKAD